MTSDLWSGGIKMDPSYEHKGANHHWFEGHCVLCGTSVESYHAGFSCIGAPGKVTAMTVQDRFGHIWKDFLCERCGVREYGLESRKECKIETVAPREPHVDQDDDDNNGPSFIGTAIDLGLSLVGSSDSTDISCNTDAAPEVDSSPSFDGGETGGGGGESGF